MPPVRYACANSHSKAAQGSCIPRNTNRPPTIRGWPPRYGRLVTLAGSLATGEHCVVDETHGWTRFECGHRHRRWISQWGFAEDRLGYRFKADRPVFATITADQSDALGPMVVLEPGTALRLDAAIDDHSPGSDAYWGLFRCQVESGPHAGTSVVLSGTRSDWSVPAGFVRSG